MFISVYVVVGCAVVLPWRGSAAGPVCSGVLVSCCSVLHRASRGHEGGRMTGPRRAEQVTPILPQQTHPFAVRLSPHCHAARRHGSRHVGEPDAALSIR